MPWLPLPVPLERVFVFGFLVKVVQPCLRERVQNLMRKLFDVHLWRFHEAFLSGSRRRVLNSVVRGLPATELDRRCDCDCVGHGFVWRAAFWAAAASLCCLISRKRRIAWSKPAKSPLLKASAASSHSASIARARAI